MLSNHLTILGPFLNGLGYQKDHILTMMHSLRISNTWRSSLGNRINLSWKTLVIVEILLRRTVNGKNVENVAKDVIGTKRGSDRKKRRTNQVGVFENGMSPNRFCDG